MTTTKYQAVSIGARAASPKDGHPIKKANAFSKLLFRWATPLMALGNERQLDPADVWPLQLENQCSVVGRVFEPVFIQSHSIMWAIASVFGWDMLWILVMQVGKVLGSLYGPYVLQQIVLSMESNAGFDITYCLELIASLVVVRVVSALLSAHSDLQMQMVVVKVTSALQHLLFQKSLRLDATSRRVKSTGEISNLFLTDIPTIVVFSMVGNELVILPVQIILTLWLLYTVIGWSTFVGAAVVVFTLGGNQFLSNAIETTFDALMSQKDTRMKAINEMFGAMQIIKLNAWEEMFAAKLAVERTKELEILWRVFVLVTITSYTLLQHQTLPASTLFTALSYFTMLKFPFSSLSMTISSTMQALVSLRRVTEFLDLTEKNATTVLTPATAPKDRLQNYVDNDVVVAIENASIGWDVATPLFRNVNLTIKRGEFVVVHGSVGEGKSSLCAALLGEMDKFNGSIFVGGRVAYYSQQAWIQNMTIRDNILFGHPYDRVKYNNVLAACALSKDLTLFPAGDRTEIGQKGVNLSGGQKAHISLARVCYSDADIFILDSPLSAVDAIVQNEIFTECFLGLLRLKTIVLVTHSPEIIASSFIHRTIEVKDGQVVDQDVVALETSHDRTILIDPMLPSRPGFQVSNDDEVLTKAYTPTPHDYSTIMSPSVSSPLGGLGDNLFTPVMKLRGQTFDDVSGQLVQDEERMQGDVSLSVYSEYLDAAGGYGAMVSLLFGLILWQALTVGSDLWLNVWTGTVATESPQQFLAQTWYYLGIYAALAFLAVFATVIQSLIVYSSCMKASRALFEHMTDALVAAPMSFFDTTPVGRILNRYTNDVGTIDVSIPFQVAFIVSSTFVTVCSVATAVYMTSYIGLVVLPLLYVFVLTGRFYVKPARELERVNKITKSPLLNLISEAIEGVLVIRAFGDNQLRRFQCLHFRNVDATNESMFAKEVVTTWFVLRIQFISAMVLMVVSVALVLLRSQLTPGLVGLALNYIFSSLSILEYMIPSYAQFETLMVGPERVAEYCRIQPEPPRVISGAVAHDWPTNGDIAFTNMAFRYKVNDPLVLQDVTVHIQSGEKVGIVGRTGAGKSSLIMALFRINELARGSIHIDGVDISRIGVKTLRSSIAIIPQTPVLFKGTLRNYLDPFDEFVDADLWGCLQKVRLADRIAAVEGKLDSPVEENGENFSVGERQMLCMARALLRQARIVVMDEATAAIDHETDQNLQRVIRTEFATSTVLTIAHRLDTVLDADRILVFDQGRLAQCDSPAALIGAGAGIFFELCHEGGYLDKVVNSQPLE